MLQVSRQCGEEKGNTIFSARVRDAQTQPHVFLLQSNSSSNTILDNVNQGNIQIPSDR